jgi:hypothetical protein
VVPLEEFKSRLFEYQGDAVTNAQVQTPVSRLRVSGLPIPSRSYMLDVPPGAVDIVDFDTRAREFNEATAHLERVGDEEISALLEEGTRLHHLWRYDPAAAVRGHPRLSGLFDSYRGRHRRFGTRLVRSLLRAGEGDQAEDILDQYFERYPGHEALRGLEVELRRTSSRQVAIRVGDGAALFPGPAARSPALAEVRERLAATNTLPFAQLALGAQNFDRRYIVGRVALNFQETPILAEAVSPGGAAPNTAVALARLGQRVTVAGIVADDHEGTVIRESLLEEGVDLSPFQTVLEALFRWRAARVDRPLVVVVKRPRHAEGQLEPSTEGYEMITIAVGRRSVEELVSARVPASSGVGIIDNIGQGDAIAAAVHLGLLRGGPLDECANLASVLANEVASEIGTRAGLPYRSTIRPAWAKYFPLVDLPPWVPTG